MISTIGCTTDTFSKHAIFQEILVSLNYWFAKSKLQVTLICTEWTCANLSYHNLIDISNRLVFSAYKFD